MRSSHSHWQKSITRQRTTPCTAAIGPLSTIAASAARCASFSRDGCPGAFRSISPAGPCAFNRSTQSRTTCSVTQPALAASVRLVPSINRRQRQQPSHLVGILALTRNTAQQHRIIVQPQRDRPTHGEPLSFAGLESDHLRVGESPNESSSGSVGITWVVFGLSGSGRPIR